MSILKTQALDKIYKKKKRDFTAVDSVNIEVDYGQCVGLVGESGCGKSTIAKLITGLEKSTAGSIFIEDKEVTNYNNKQKIEMYKIIQMVFQNPVDSFNPRRTLGESIGEIKINFGEKKKEVKEEVLELLNMVGLGAEYYDRYPSKVSGGECQRAAIARVLAINPKIIVCDEITSALDVSVQAQIVSILKMLQNQLSLSYIFISHDLALVKNICEKIYVMYRGQIVESGVVKEVIDNPKHPYTKLLLESISLENFDEELNENTSLKENHICKFYNRCKFKSNKCDREKVTLRYLGGTHYSSCCIEL